jgi:hypothetical protein
LAPTRRWAHDGPAGVAKLSDVGEGGARESTPTFTVSARGDGEDALVLEVGSAHLHLPVAVTDSP